ncbi:MAG: amino acid ABC transporter permease [Acidisphaera sp.]|nr:amino acid ABC transporter permease [Acidisphaera sp.]
MNAAGSQRLQAALWWLGVAIAVIVAAERVRRLEWAAVAPSLPFLLTALGRSWVLAIVSIACGVIAAFPLALTRLYGPRGLRQLATGAIEAVRATPELMVIFWVYFTWPYLAGNQVTAWNAALGSLSVIAAAYLAEVIRAGISSVPAGQVEASIASGMSGLLTFRYIVLPQALRNMLPALLAQLVALFKTTSLVYAIGVMDFFRAVAVTKNAVFAPYALYLILGAGYFVSCFAIGRIVRWFDPRYQLLE